MFSVLFVGIVEVSRSEAGLQDGSLGTFGALFLKQGKFFKFYVLYYQVELWIHERELCKNLVLSWRILGIECIHAQKIPCKTFLNKNLNNFILFAWLKHFRPWVSKSFRVSCYTLHDILIIIDINGKLLTSVLAEALGLQLNSILHIIPEVIFNVSIIISLGTTSLKILSRCHSVSKTPVSSLELPLQLQP